MFARENRILFFDECSALADINIKDIFSYLIDSIYDTQVSLIQQGMKTPQELKLRNEDFSPNYEVRQCCY